MQTSHWLASWAAGACLGGPCCLTQVPLAAAPRDVGKSPSYRLHSVPGVRPDSSRAEASEATTTKQPLLPRSTSCSCLINTPALIKLAFL